MWVKTGDLTPHYRSAKTTCCLYMYIHVHVLIRFITALPCALTPFIWKVDNTGMYTCIYMYDDIYIPQTLHCILDVTHIHVHTCTYMYMYVQYMKDNARQMYTPKQPVIFMEKKRSCLAELACFFLPSFFHSLACIHVTALGVLCCFTLLFV